MAEQELDFELVETLDGDDETSENTNEGDDNSDDIEDGETSKKNPSNFKKLAKAHKGAMAKIKELEKQLQNTNTNNSEELRFFFLENPEAKEYKEQMLELMSNEKYKTLDIEDILDLAKLRKPTESDDKQDFNFKSNNTKVKKTLSDLSEEEALKLPNKDYLDYVRLKKGGNKSSIWG